MADRSNRFLSILILFFLAFLGMLKFLTVIQAERLGERFNQVTRMVQVSLGSALEEQD
ncbi:MAG: hypothetical protein JXA82_05220 [Sedimentisphaerales bacterium]|nr:hypothetical protein [Sedimentisphaerales bacterium]